MPTRSERKNLALTRQDDRHLGANAKVFEDFDQLRRLYGRLPEEFTAEDVGRTGITGSRRHMIVRHLAEHPAFDCELAARKPLRAKKMDDHAADETTGASGVDEPGGEASAD